MARAVVKAAAGVAVLAAGLTGCVGGGGEGAAADEPVRDGGTLRVVGSSDVEHLDPASVASVGAYGLVRTFARTLFGTRASNGFAATVPVRPDVAERIPTRKNGDVSDDRETYTVRLREDVRWNTEPPRPVTAHDFVRGFERLCNPAAPSIGRGYYVSTLVGMQTFCDGFLRVDPRSPAAMAAYQHEHEIEGVRAKDDRTLVFELEEPASDFLHLLALPFTAAAPQEYDRYIPDGPDFRRHTISNGPYQIVEYRPGISYVLARNPAWRAQSDPLRERHVDRIRVTLGQDSAEAVQQQIEQGTADLAWDQPVPTSAVPRLRDDPRFAIMEAPSSSPYLVFNLLSPNNGGALGKADVRRALQYAIDKSTLVKLVGGPAVASPLHTVIPPGNSGHAPVNHYPTPDDSGDPAKCRALLARAGHPNLTLKFPYRTNSLHKLLAESIAENLASCGVTAELMPDAVGSFYGGTITTPARARAGQWDIAAPGWTPDWYGNNGRSIIQPLFDGRTYGDGSTNYGGYNNPRVNELIDAALTASGPEEAAECWRQADVLIMRDAAIVPLLSRSHTIFRSSRVRNAHFLPTASGYDYTRIWLAEDD
ncbi:ABC transporter substrate-binding protein [Actinomadura algeriensis]|uniref:Peptide/nickel transport system substrate-binding protein n=1 Tax=Actinomadura algeriensis TaxID=1679523 RepID=A0ABR9JP80_9ACTN|nr:ABC transporter substrate-binding protein [Actinomadura algeriensis]MBE1532360.1 peptide/nickel transport system substrate-binding protein [Actinomadura algeriensis]